LSGIEGNAIKAAYVNSTVATSWIFRRRWYCTVERVFQQERHWSAFLDSHGRVSFQRRGQATSSIYRTARCWSIWEIFCSKYGNMWVVLAYIIHRRYSRTLEEEQ